MKTKMRYLDTNYNQANLSIDSGVMDRINSKCNKESRKDDSPFIYKFFQGRIRL